MHSWILSSFLCADLFHYVPQRKYEFEAGQIFVGTFCLREFEPQKISYAHLHLPKNCLLCAGLLNKHLGMYGVIQNEQIIQKDICRKCHIDVWSDT